MKEPAVPPRQSQPCGKAVRHARLHDHRQPDKPCRIVTTEDRRYHLINLGCQPAGIQRPAKRRGGKTCILHQRDGHSRPRSGQQTAHLIGNPLARQVGGKTGLLGERRQRVIIRAGSTEMRQEPAIAQHPQRVLFNAPGRGADKPQDSSLKIGASTKRVLDPAGFIDIERVDGEITTRGVHRPVIAEGDDGMTTIRLQINACLGHLQMLTILDHRDSAMIKAGIDDLQAIIAKQTRHPVDRRGDGHVDITDCTTNKPVTDRAANDPRVKP